MLTPQGCAARQARFRGLLAAANIDAVVITDPRDVYYFTGRLFTSHFHEPVCLVLQTGGGGWLIGPSTHGVTNVDEAATYPHGINSTMNMDWQTKLSIEVEKRLARLFGVRRIGWQAESMPRKLAQVFNLAGPMEWVEIDGMLNSMQRKKDADELASILEAIRCDLAAYTAVQEMIEPGVNELELLGAGTKGALAAAGERVIHDGGYGIKGYAIDRKIVAGEMRVIDAWTCYRGYWADLCRVYIVGDRPTDEQQGFYDHVGATHKIVAPMFKPGVKGTEISAAADAWLRQHPILKDSGLTHHAGHGCGLRAHMEPDLNSMREGVLEEGDVVCFEPGGYSEAHNCFVRIEDMYLITDSGSENLTNYPYNLVRTR